MTSGQRISLGRIYELPIAITIKKGKVDLNTSDPESGFESRVMTETGGSGTFDDVTLNVIAAEGDTAIIRVSHR